MQAFAVIFPLLMVLIPSSQGLHGVDVSTFVDVDRWTCLKNNGTTFAVIRIYRSLGKVDANAAKTIKNARAAGISNVDGYIFPCFKCGNPRGQVQDALDNLRKNEAPIGQVWLDVEGTDYWGPSGPDNINFIRELAAEVKAQNYSVGIYSSASQWNPITKSSTDLGDIPLWYAHWDKKDNFSDFKPFGGFTSPVMKQYVGDASICDTGVDLNWRP